MAKKVTEIQFVNKTKDYLDDLIEKESSGGEILKQFNAFKDMPFKEFLVDIWAYGYDRPAELKAWYLEEIADNIQTAIDNRSNLSLIMPRGHRKSTIMHGLSIWSLLTLDYSQTTVLYLSATEDSAKKHVAELRNAVFRNPKLDFISSFLSENNLNFEIRLPDYRVKLLDYKGIVQLKRGYHLDGILIMDDIYDDPSDPDSPKLVLKINKMYDTKVKPIPNPGYSSQFLIGTPISKQDLFNIVPDRDYWTHLFYEVFTPEPGTDNDTLAPHIVDKEKAANLEKEDYISFQSEYRCVPYYDSQSFLTTSDIGGLINEDSKTWDISRNYTKEPGEMTVLGADLGRHRDPTHISVFSVKGKLIRQIYSEYLEQVPYPEQVSFLNRLIYVFNLDVGLIDNTNASLEDLGIDLAVYNLITFTKQNKSLYANAFAHLVKTSYNMNDMESHQHVYKYNLEYTSVYLEFLPDKRQNDQIVMVNKELKSPRNKDGHGDAFFSNALALGWIKSNFSNNQPVVLGSTKYNAQTADEEDQMKRKMGLIAGYRRSANNPARNFLTP